MWKMPNMPQFIVTWQNLSELFAMYAGCCEWLLDLQLPFCHLETDDLFFPDI